MLGEWIHFSLYSILTSISLSIIFVAVARRYALRAGFFDRPGKRKLQSKAVPLLGGVGMVAALAATVCLPQLMADLVPAALRGPDFCDAPFPAIWSGGLLLLSVGLLDDRLGDRFPFQAKLAAQVAAAGLALAGAPAPDWIGQPLADTVISLIWLVGITNAMNLLDNMDGLAAGTATLACLALASVFWQFGNQAAGYFALAVAGTCTGFLRHNFHPAKIFMGDAGSHFLGFVLAVLGMQLAAELSGGQRYATPLLILSIPIFDMLSVICIRVREGRPIFIGDRCHLSHRLVLAGLSQRGAVIVLWCLAATSGFAALGVATQHIPAGPAIALALAASFAIHLGLAKKIKNCDPEGDSHGERHARSECAHTGR